MGLAHITERVYLDDEGKATTDPSQGRTLWASPGSTKKLEECERVGYSGFESRTKDSSPSHPEPEHVGGGWYQLPDGSKVRGKDEAQKRLAAQNKERGARNKGVSFGGR